tara:strand:+ start:1259 stop:1384 length:126 start_codon:yes stop_codon:yes gene_type:complete
MICPSTLQDMIKRYYDLLENLTNKELDALAHMCVTMKEEEE